MITRVELTRGALKQLRYEVRGLERGTVEVEFVEVQEVHPHDY